MTNYTEKSEQLLAKILLGQSAFEEIAKKIKRHSKNDSSYCHEDYKSDDQRIKNILNGELSFNFLYYGEPHANSKEDFAHEISIDKVQCLADVGIYLAKKQTLSNELKLFLITRTNIVGFLFDRHRYSYYIHQEKIKQFVDAYAEIQILNNNDFFENVSNLYKILYEVNANIEDSIRKDIAYEIFGYTSKAEQERENELKVSEQNVLEKLNQLNHLRKLIRTEFKSVRFGESLGSKNSKINDIEVVISEYVTTSQKIYQDIVQDNDKNIGGRVAVIDTNLEYEKLVSSNGKYKFNTPSSLHFEEIHEAENIFRLAENENIEIDSIKIKK